MEADAPADACYRCGRPATATCPLCGQPSCSEHGTDLCDECAAGVNTERALAVSFNGCAAGCVSGIVVVALTLLLAPSLVRGTGDAIGIAVVAGLALALLAYALVASRRV